MKKHFYLLLFLAIAALTLNVFGQNTHETFEVKITGNGKESILFIPGFACSGEVWNETKAFFESDFTCYTLTMAGFAGVPAKDGVSFQNWEKEIASYIQNQKINKPIVIGHSMGGALALALAADYPDLVSKIVVVDALPFLAGLMDPNAKSDPNNDCSQMVSQFTSVPDAQFYQIQKQAISQLVADTSQHERIIHWSVISDRTTFARMFCDFSNTDLRDKIASITCPSLILLESYFYNFGPAINEQYKNLKTADLRYATKGLHFIMFDDYEWYISQLSNFIKH